MEPATSIEFIDAALSCIGPLALSYKESNKKWIIREHLISLLQEFESLLPSIDTFTYNDGTTVNLLNLNGFLQVSPSTPPIPLTIWIHQNYPNSPPLVFLPAIHHDNPFVDSSGSITSPYLETWTCPRSNLLDLARNLIRLFAHHCTLFSVSASIVSNSTDPSKMEALDLLVATLQSDVVALQVKAEEDIEALSGLQAELVDRADILTAIMLGIEYERSSLKQRVMEMTKEADVLMNWLRVHDPKSIIFNENDEMEATFEAADEESGKILECLAAEEAIEDVVYALDKAMVEGVVSLGDYLKQVRILSREQFFYKAMLVQLRCSDILQI